MRELDKDNLLRSWKEIATYLGVDVRTCHRWEARHGMPVHRIEGTEKRSNVFAYKDELDAWFKRTFRNHNPTEAGAEAKTGKHRPWVKWTAGAILILASAGAYRLVDRLLTKRQPADFRIEGSELVVLDKHKRELWRHDTKLEDLKPESYYRMKFQTLNDVAEEAFPIIVIKDIDGDGDTEVLFTPKQRGDSADLGLVSCFDRRGAEKWPPFYAGRELKCGDRVFSPDFRVKGFVCHDADGDGRLETFVFSYHAPDWPCQLAVLDASGKMVGEYWNAGYLLYCAFKDIDADGRDELVVAGVNNEYRGGCLAVFDPLRISGGSPQSGRFACEGIGPGSELYYVTVPFTDVSEALGVAVAGLTHVSITKNDLISAWYPPSLYYEFDFGLACRQVYWGHGYELAHGDLVKAGKISSVLGPDYGKMLRDAVRWWNGSAWVSEPTKVLR
jgi:hypothetical protein